MSTERNLQTKLIKCLRDRGFYVIKTKPGTGVPVGCPDVLAFHGKNWAAFEVKSHELAPFQPLQKLTLDKLNNWSFARMVHPKNFDEVIAELDLFFIDSCISCQLQKTA